MNTRCRRRVLGLAVASRRQSRNRLFWHVMTYQNILCLKGGRVLKVQAYQMLCEPAVEGTIHLIEDEIQKVESRNERGWKVDVTCNRQVHVIFGADGVGCCEN